MKGDFARAVGRGRLRRAGLALVLRPRTSAARPSILATTGPSSDADTLLRTRSPSAVARVGNTVEFVIAGGGLENVGRIQVKAFRRLPGRGGRARAADDIRLSRGAAALLSGRDGRRRRDRPGPGPSDDEECSELRATAIAFKERRAQILAGS